MHLMFTWYIINDWPQIVPYSIQLSHVHETPVEAISPNSHGSYIDTLGDMLELASNECKVTVMGDLNCSVQCPIPKLNDRPLDVHHG